MNEGLRQRAEEVFAKVLAAEDTSREAILEQHCGKDSQLREYVERLLDADAGATEDRFLEPDVVPANPLVSDALSGTRSEEGARTGDGRYAENDYFVGRWFGDYQVKSLLGMGGMGQVYLAQRERGDFQQTVAVKLMFADAMGDEARVRFNLERQTLSTLRHPYLVALLGGGEADFPEIRCRVPYFVMEYVDGKPLNEYCDTECLTLDERIAIFVKVCEAVVYCHRQGVLHRDLKPRNIFVASDGRPRILDFGIAKIVQADGDQETLFQTQPGHTPFTPRYASPEQIRGESLSTSSDVYSLGVLLYELLTGVPPYHFPSAHPQAILRVLERGTLRKPSERFQGSADDPGDLETRCRHRSSVPQQLVRRLEGDLDTIILKSVSPSRELRYATVSELVEDLHAFLESRPIKARPPGTVKRFTLWARRSPVLAGSLVLAALFALAFFVSTVAYNIRLKDSLGRESASADRARSAQRAEARAAKEARESAEIAHNRLYQVGIRATREHVRRGEMGLAAIQLQQAEPDAMDGRDLRGFEYYWLKHQILRPGIWRTRAHEGAVVAVVAGDTAPDTVRSFGMDGIVRYWQINEGQLQDQWALPFDQPPRRLVGAFSPLGDRLITGDADGTLALWDVDHRQQLFKLEYPKTGAADTAAIGKGVDRDSVHQVGFSAGGATLFACVGRQRLIVWDAASGEFSRAFSHINPITVAAVDGSSQTAFIPGLGVDAVRFAEDSTALFRTLPSSGGVEFLCLSPNAHWLLEGTSEGHVTLWHDPGSDSKASVLSASNTALSSSAFHPLADQVVAGTTGGTVQWWNMSNGQHLGTFRGHQDVVRSVAITPDGTRVVAASEDGHLIAWLLQAPHEAQVVGVGEADVVWDVASWDSDEDGEVMAIAGGDLRTALGLFGDKSAEESTEQPRTDPAEVWTWQPGSPAEAVPLQSGAASYSHMDVSPDGRFLAVSTSSLYSRGRVDLWDLETGTRRTIFADEPGTTHMLSFVPGGRWLIVARGEAIPAPGRPPDFYPGRISLVDIYGQHRPSPTLDSSHAAMALAVSPDGKHAAVGGKSGGEVQWFDIASATDSTDPSAEPLSAAGRITVADEDWGVSALTWTGDDVLAVACFPSTSPFAGSRTLLWSFSAEEPAAVLSGPRAAVSAFELLPDNQLLGASFDGQIYLWNSLSGETLRQLPIGQPIFALASATNVDADASASTDCFVNVLHAPDPMWQVRRVRLDTGRTVDSFQPIQFQGAALAVVPAGKSAASSIVTGDILGGRLQRWSADSGEPWKPAATGSPWGIQRDSTTTPHSGSVMSLDVSTNQHGDARLASGDSRGTVALWDVESGQLLDRQQGGTSRVGRVAFSPDGKWVAAALGNDPTTVLPQAGGVVVWRIKDRRLTAPRSLLESEHGALALAFSPDSRWLVASEGLAPESPNNRDRGLWVWDVASGDRDQERSFRQDASNLTVAVAFSPDGRHLATVGLDETPTPQARVTAQSDQFALRMWDWESGDLIYRATGHEQIPAAVGFSPDGRTLATADGQSDLLLWQASSGTLLMRLKTPLKQVLRLKFSSGGQALYAAGIPARESGPIYRFDAPGLSKAER